MFEMVYKYINGEATMKTKVIPFIFLSFLFIIFSANIFAQTFTWTHPVSSDVWPGGSNQNIIFSWSGGNSSYGSVYVQYSTDGSNWTNIGSSRTIYRSGNTISWSVPNSPSSSYRIRLRQSSTTLSTSQLFTVSGLSLTSPNGGESWEAGSSHNITWTSAGITNVKLEYQTAQSGAGATWVTIIASTAASAGSYSWTLPNVSTNDAQVRISDASNSSTNDKSNDFTIFTRTITVTSPNGGETFYIGGSNNINWSSSNVGSNVKIEYSTDSGSSWNTITNSTSNDGSYTWNPVPNAPTIQARVKITSTTYTSVSDVSNNDFTIATPSLTVTNPSDAGITIIKNCQYTIRWTDEGLSSSEYVVVEYSTDGGSTWPDINAQTSNDGSCSWTPNFTAPSVLVKVSWYGHLTVFDVGDNSFSIVDPVLTVNTPGADLIVGCNYNIQWDYNGCSDIDYVRIYKGADVIVDHINNDGHYNWTVEGPAVTGTKFKVVQLTRTYTVDGHGGGGTYVYHETDLYGESGTFNIVDGTLNITSPVSGTNWNVCERPTITWEGTTCGDVKIEYSPDGGAHWSTIVNQTNNDGSYTPSGYSSWQVPLPGTTNAQVRISVNGISDVSDAFTVIAPELVLSSPIGGENWQVASNQNITWTSAGVTSVDVFLSSNDGASWTQLAENATSPLSWVVWDWPTANAKIKLIGTTSCDDITVVSNAFTISEPTTLPAGVGGGVVVSSDGNGIYILDCATQTLTGPFLTSEGELNDILFDPVITPDGMTAIVTGKISGSFSGVSDVDEHGGHHPDHYMIYFVDITVPTNPALLGSIDVGTDKVQDIDVTPDGKYVVVVGDGISLGGLLSSKIFIADIANRALITPVYQLPYGKYANAVSIAPDGTVLVADVDHLSDGHVYSLTIDASGVLVYKGSKSINGNPTNILISPVYQNVPGMPGEETPSITSGYNVLVCNSDLRYVKKLVVNNGNIADYGYLDLSAYAHGDFLSGIFSLDGLNAYLFDNGTYSGGGWTSPEGHTYPSGWQNYPQVHKLDVNGLGSITYNSSITVHSPRSTDEYYGVDELAVDSQNKFLYVSTHGEDNSATDVKVIDLQNNAVVKGLPLSSGDNPLGIYISANFGKAVALITLTQPNDAGITVNAGQTYQIKWNCNMGVRPSSGLTTTIPVPKAVLWYRLGDSDSWHQIAEVSQNLGENTYNWTVPFYQSQTCLVKVSNISDPTLFDVSNNYFTIFGLQLTAPNESEIIKVGTLYTVKWNGSPYIPDVMIDYSTDAGATWLPLVASTPNTGSITLTVPNTPSYSAVVRVSKVGLPMPFGVYDIFDKSDVAHTLEGILEVTPNGNTWNGGMTYTIVWQSTVNGGGATSNSLGKDNTNVAATGTVKIEYSIDNGATWILIAKSAPDIGKFDWILPYIQSTNCLVRITSNEDPTISDITHIKFEIWVVRVLKANGGEHWGVGYSHQLTWEISDFDSKTSTSKFLNYIKLEYSTNNGSTWSIIRSRFSATSLIYPWTVPNVQSDQCLVRVSKFDDAKLQDVSNNVFSIGSTGTTENIIVWPGDADNDGDVDQYDFNIVKKFENKVGTPRINGSSNWVGQEATPWYPLESTYADCNGDGVVNSDDFYVILSVNWGKTHNGLVKMNQVVVTDYKLLQNYPNPFNPSTILQFELPELSRIDLKIYDMLGEEVAVLANDEEYGYGVHQLEWHPENLASGVYIYRMNAKSIETGKMITIVKKMQYLR